MVRVKLECMDEAYRQEFMFLSALLESSLTLEGVLYRVEESDLTVTLDAGTDREMLDRFLVNTGITSGEVPVSVSYIS